MTEDFGGEITPEALNSSSLKSNKSCYTGDKYGSLALARTRCQLTALQGIAECWRSQP
ncbi:hypothetical protein [Gloeocapsa sp. PCC 7428]|uniref:hypothetical protein n=1 Tax=Gloeocapsa sp. PCC 7428 TaxID=1173026 RepID=UPI0002D4F6BB|nr:hypothetical protein [Gloeocapsa sp. PCC 7428]